MRCPACGSFDDKVVDSRQADDGSSIRRVEAAYMRDHLAFPFDTWNYAHNRNYLSYIQEELGMPKAAIQGARELMSIPFDPKYNNPKRGNRSGKVALLRAQIRYEMWKLRSSIQSAPKSQTTTILLARRQVVSFRLLFCAFPSPSARQAHIFYASLFHTRPDATNVA